MHRRTHAVVGLVRVAHAALVVLQTVGLGHKPLQELHAAHAPHLGLRRVRVQLRSAVCPVAGVQCAVTFRPDMERREQAGGRGGCRGKGSRRREREKARRFSKTGRRGRGWDLGDTLL